MNYPIWELPHVGGGTLIAIIAILHVYISHLAVGGGLFLWLTDLKAVRTKDNNLREYVKKHTWFFSSFNYGVRRYVGSWYMVYHCISATGSDFPTYPQFRFRMGDRMGLFHW